MPGATRNAARRDDHQKENGMSSQQRSRRLRVATAPVAGLAALALLACASAGVSNTRRYVSDDEVERPGVILVYDFRVSAGDVTVDKAGPSITSGPGSPAERSELGVAVSQGLAQALVEELGKRGIAAQRADGRTSPPLHALLLKGRFLTVNEGDQSKRMVVGFGAGASELRVDVQVYQETEFGARRISEGEAKASGSKMPGMAVPVGAGAAAGRAATSAAISGAMSVTREIRGGMSADTKRLAEKIADRAEAFYERQGWL